MQDHQMVVWYFLQGVIAVVWGIHSHFFLSFFIARSSSDGMMSILCVLTVLSLTSRVALWVYLSCWLGVLRLRNCTSKEFVYCCVLFGFSCGFVVCSLGKWLWKHFSWCLMVRLLCRRSVIFYKFIRRWGKILSSERRFCLCNHTMVFLINEILHFIWLSLLFLPSHDFIGHLANWSQKHT